MKTIKEAKSRLIVGARLLCVENTYRPELNGTTRVVTKVGATVWQWRFEGKDGERPSHSDWPSGIKVIDDATIRIPLNESHHLTLRFLDAPPEPAEKTSPSLIDHTPGPWTFVKVITFSGGEPCGHKWVANLDHPHRPSDRVEVYREPNKNLIEAAPDLLALCRDALAQCSDHHQNFHYYARKDALALRLRAVLAKAEGRIDAQAEGIQSVRQAHEETREGATKGAEAEAKT